MEVNPLVFETSASTDSAIWASHIDFSIAVQRYEFFLYPQYFLEKNKKKQKTSGKPSLFIKYSVL